MKKIIKICEIGDCKNQCKWVTVYKGILYQVCTGHRCLINKQNKADNNI